MKKTQSNNSNLGAKFKRKCKSLLILFWTMFKIGLFTFGGGYAMIHLLENEFVSKKKWLDNDEFFDLVTIAESTPGPVAINCSTYIGYKTEKILGSFVATTAMCLPSFIIIFVISLFFNAFLENTYVAAAFKGIQVCAVFLILCAGIKMAKKLKKSIFNLILFIATFAAMILVSIFNAKFSSIFYILISGAIGLFIYSVGYFKDKMKLKKATANNSEIALDENSNATCINTDEQVNANSDIETNNEIETTDINAEQVCDNNEIKNENSVSPENVTLNKSDCSDLSDNDNEGGAK